MIERTLLLFGLLAPAGAADVIHVDNTNPQNLGVAATNSSPGDVLLVEPGTYDPFTIPHELTVLADGGPVLVTNVMSSVPAIGGTVRIEGPGTGTVTLAGLEIVISAWWLGAFSSPAVRAAGIDSLVLLDCDVRREFGPLDGAYFGQPAISGSVPVYLADCGVQGGGSFADTFYFPFSGSPALQVDAVVARGSRLEAGRSGESVLTPFGGCSGENLTCDSFVPGIDGVVGSAAVLAPQYFGQTTELVPASGVWYYCCPIGCDSGFNPCGGAGLTPLGNGPTGPELIGQEIAVPTQLDGAPLAPIGADYTLAWDAGVGGGVLLTGRDLIAPVAVGTFGWLMLDPSQTLIVTPLPPGSGAADFSLPPEPALVGERFAFQAWDAVGGLGLPLVALVTP